MSGRRQQGRPSALSGGVRKSQPEIFHKSKQSRRKIKRHKKEMAQLKEIFERESQRGTAESCTVIHLFQEGTFYRAYEWSAWLCVRYM